MVLARSVDPCENRRMISGRGMSWSIPRSRASEASGFWNAGKMNFSRLTLAGVDCGDMRWIAQPEMRNSSSARASVSDSGSGCGGSGDSGSAELGDVRWR